MPAFLASPQLFGTLLNFHPHVHGLVSAGIFDREATFSIENTWTHGLYCPIYGDDATADAWEARRC